MSRRDYRALAAILKRRTLPVGLMDELCDWLASDNPRFDAQRFRDASLPARPARTLVAVGLDEQVRKVASR